MTLQQLHYAIVISETGSLSRAAEVLYVAQPSLTSAIKELEKEVGITIFNRTGRGVTITNDGAEFLLYAKQVYSQYEALEEKYGRAGNLKKKFCVSAQHYSFAVKAFIETVKQFDTLQYEFAIRETKTKDVIDDVATLRSEIGILYLSNFNRAAIGKLLRASNLVFHKLIDIRAYIYVCKDHPLAGLESVHFSDRADYPCLSFEQGGNSSFYFAEEMLSTYDYPRIIKACDRATICMPYHKLLDGLEEDRLGDKKFGSTRRGISPVYSDKFMKKALRMGDLKNLDHLRGRIADIIEWKNLTVGGYGHEPIDVDEIMAWLEKYGKPFADYVCDTTVYLTDAVKAGKSVMFEAQLGALRDIDFGIYPYTSASTTLAAYAPIGSGVPQLKLDESIGIMKAYSSCVGEGPFTCELFGDEAHALREAGGEYGAATGRPRRVGGFDVVASRYGAMMQGCTCIALTKLDVMSYMDKIPVCVAYELDGKRIENFPGNIEELERAKPIYEYVEGFKCDISGCRKPEDLPKAALDYVKFIEKAVGCPIKYVSVSAEREGCIEMF